MGIKDRTSQAIQVSRDSVHLIPSLDTVQATGLIRVVVVELDRSLKQPQPTGSEGLDPLFQATGPRTTAVLIILVGQDLHDLPAHVNFIFVQDDDVAKGRVIPLSATEVTGVPMYSHTN